MEGAWGGVLPAIYGHEAAGVVTEVGPGVTLATPGDEVVVTLIRSCGRCYFCAQGQPHMCEATFPLNRENRLHTKAGQPIHQGLRTGAFAEYVVVHESQVVPISAEMPLDSASLLACGVITGLGAVTNTAQVPAGSSVVVVGVGGVGLNSIQGASLSGAQPIIAIDLVNSKLEAAQSFGATHTINPAGENPLDVVRSLTQGRGADYVFVTVGSVKAMEDGLTLLRRAGTLVIVGMPAVGAKLQLEAVDFADNGQHLLGSKMGSTRLHVDVPKLVELYQQGRLKLDELITTRYPLEEINEAIAAVKQGEALRNVVVFEQ
jgi:S-(hydroxymethyl)glutathione dehydrogenase/alcohol dehydrogenase